MKKKTKIIIIGIGSLFVISRIYSIISPLSRNNIQNINQNANYHSTEFETFEEPVNISSETDLEIVTREGHPTYYGSIYSSHVVWDDVTKGKIIFGDSNSSFNQDTILSMSAYRNSDLIRGICISFSNFETPVNFSVENTLPIIASYMPYEIMNQYYQFLGSKLLVPNNDNTTNREKYYIISYELNDDGKTAYYEGTHEYSGSIDIIITVDQNEIVNNFSIGFGTPRWMSSLNTNSYHQENWDCNLYDYKQ